jgi:hypothetical protein
MKERTRARRLVEKQITSLGRKTGAWVGLEVSSPNIDGLGSSYVRYEINSLGTRIRLTSNLGELDSLNGVILDLPA